jgi:hypothetical protein
MHFDLLYLGASFIPFAIGSSPQVRELGQRREVISFDIKRRLIR